MAGRSQTFRAGLEPHNHTAAYVMRPAIVCRSVIVVMSHNKKPCILDPLHSLSIGRTIFDAWPVISHHRATKVKNESVASVHRGQNQKPKNALNWNVPERLRRVQHRLDPQAAGTR
jgi:hypothetical protein